MVKISSLYAITILSKKTETKESDWYGKKAEFDEAIEWFRELLVATNLSGSDITFCPGNHDVNRAYGNYMTDLNYKDIDTIDRVYQYEHIHRMEAPLYNYEKFCEALGVVPYHYPKADRWEASYAIGYKDIRIIFVFGLFSLISFIV